MALKSCKECGGRISTKAEACPGCGAVLKRQTGGCAGCVGLLGLLVFVVVVISMMSDTSLPRGSNRASKEPPEIAWPAPKPKSQEDLRMERIKRSFSPWDGSHRGLEALVEQSMNDPGSYEHAETLYWDMGDHLVVKTSFRGKNAFGGVVLNWVKAKVDLDGNVLEVLEQGP